jgi:light-regulated signal transduction histidine kinase (bacteriophytochrome)
MSPMDYRENPASLREFQDFLDRAIHGLRAPLRGIATSAETLSRKWNEHFDEEGRGLMRSILQGVANLNEFTKSLADYSLPVASALQTAMASLRTKIEETGAQIYSGTLPRLAADHEQLSVLFRCLLSNALEYRSNIAAPRIEITATAAEDEWRFAVSDNGVGIAPRFHRQVFEPFERLQGGLGGFGLGLAISRKIVLANGGRLWVDSREGEGSTFFFTLPMDSAPA